MKMSSQTHSEMDLYNESKKPFEEFLKTANNEYRIIRAFGLCQILGDSISPINKSTVDDARRAISNLDALRNDAPKWVTYIKTKLIFPEGTRDDEIKRHMFALKNVLEHDEAEEATRKTLWFLDRNKPENAQMLQDITKGLSEIFGMKSSSREDCEDCESDSLPDLEQ